MIVDPPCGSGCDKDGQWDLRKERSGTGWTFVYDMSTGESSENDNCASTVQLLQLGFRF